MVETSNWTALETRTSIEIEEALRDFQGGDRTSKLKARNFLNSESVKDFVFAIFCIHEEDPGLCRDQVELPVWGSFDKVYTWWKVYGDCNKRDYSILCFRNQVDAWEYRLKGHEKPFHPGKDPIVVPRFIRYMELVAVEVIRNLESFQTSEILPKISSALKAHYGLTYSLSTLRKGIYTLYPLMEKRGYIYQLPLYRSRYFVSRVFLP